jgi:excisionase family DNA binding protein
MTPIKKRRTKSGRDRATYTVNELMRVLGLSRSGVYAALRDGTIPNFRVGRRFVIPKVAVESKFKSMGQHTSNAGSSRL